MRDGRLAIGVTKFDRFYCYQALKKQTHRGALTVENVKEKLISSIKDTTGTMVFKDTIIPLCGEWALTASRLASCLISDPNNEKKKRLEEAVDALAWYPHLSLPGGQDQSPEEAIEPMDVIDHLEKASGISYLKKR